MYHALERYKNDRVRFKQDENSEAQTFLVDTRGYKLTETIPVPSSSGAPDNANDLAFSPGNYEDVYLSLEGYVRRLGNKKWDEIMESAIQEHKRASRQGRLRTRRMLLPSGERCQGKKTGSLFVYTAVHPVLTLHGAITVFVGVYSVFSVG